MDTHPTKNTTETLHSVEAAAERFGGVSKNTVSSWLTQGKLPRTKIGRRTMIRESDIQAFIAKCNPEAKAAEPGPAEVSGPVLQISPRRQVARRLQPIG